MGSSFKGMTRNIDIDEEKLGKTVGLANKKDDRIQRRTLFFIEVSVKSAIIAVGSLTFHCFVKGSFKFQTNQKMGCRGVTTMTRFEGD
jgi:hypothetical protein